MRTESRGFTLIELMVVVMIVGIVTAFALPAYTDKVQKSRRASAKATMMQVSQQLERFYTQNSTYTTSLAALGWSGTYVPSEGGGHQITIAPGANGIASGYVIAAAPTAGDPDCGTLSMTNTNARSASGANPSICW